MSEDTTKDISSKYGTKPTLEQVLERINMVAETLQAFRSDVAEKFEQLDIRLDRIESDVSKTRSDMFGLRADFKESRNQFKEPA